MVSTKETGAGWFSLEVDEKVFPRTVSVSAAYLFLDRCYLHLERPGKDKLLVRLKGKRTMSRKALAALADEFENELLHQLMRQQVAEATVGLREVLVGRALLSAEVAGVDTDQAGEEDDLDYLDDPLGIAVPWEEKYGDDSKKKDPTDA